MATLSRVLGLGLSAAALAAPAPARAATFYVAEDGSDAAPGTSPALAWRTPARVSAQDLAPGDRVLLEAGATFAGGLWLDAADAGTEHAPVVIGSYGGGRAVLAPASGPGLHVQDAGGVVVRDLVLRGPGMDASDSHGLSFYASDPARPRLAPVRVERVEATGFGRSGIAVGSWAGATGYDGIAVEDADAHHNALGGISTYAQQRAAHRFVSVRRSRAWGNPGRPGLAKNSGSGIVLGGVDGGVVEDSVAYGNGGRDTAREGGVGIWTYDSDRVVIQRNESYGNRTGGPADGGGFDLDDRVSRSIVQHNHSHDNDGAGFLVANPSRDPAHSGNVVRYNLSERDGRRNSYPGIFLWRRTTGLVVAHNTVVGPRPALVADDLGDGSALVADNLLVRTGPGPVVSARTRMGALDFLGNAYWAPGGDVTVAWGGAVHRGLPAWRAAAGQERDGDADTGLQADPRLSGGPDATGPWGHTPAPGSPLIDAALDPVGAGGASHDLLGTPLPAGPSRDVGALEAPLLAPAPPARPAAPAQAAASAPSTTPVLRPRGKASPGLRILRIVRRGRRTVRVTGRTARTLPSGARLRVATRSRAAGGVRHAVVRRGRFAFTLRLPAGFPAAGGRLWVVYTGDAAHRSQRRSVRVPRRRGTA